MCFPVCPVPSIRLRRNQTGRGSDVTRAVSVEHTRVWIWIGAKADMVTPVHSSPLQYNTILYTSRTDRRYFFKSSGQGRHHNPSPNTPHLPRRLVFHPTMTRLHVVRRRSEHRTWIVIQPSKCPYAVSLTNSQPIPISRFLFLFLFLFQFLIVNSILLLIPPFVYSINKRLIQSRQPSLSNLTVPPAMLAKCTILTSTHRNSSPSLNTPRV
jgi:hypothetical protein